MIDKKCKRKRHEKLKKNVNILWEIDVYYKQATSYLITEYIFLEVNHVKFIIRSFSHNFLPSLYCETLSNYQGVKQNSQGTYTLHSAMNNFFFCRYYFCLFKYKHQAEASGVI